MVKPEKTIPNTMREPGRMAMALLVTLLLPALYASFRVSLLNLSLDPAQFGVITQLQWISLIFEILRDSLLALTAFHLGAVVRDAARFQTRWINAFCLIVITHATLAAIISGFDVHLLEVSGYNGLPNGIAASYLRIESFAQIPMALLAVVQAALLVLSKTRWVYGLAIGHFFVAVVADSVMIPLVISSQASTIVWVGMASATAATATLLAALCALTCTGILQWNRPQADGVGVWLKRSGIAALECTLRNAVFIWMIIRLVNLSGESTLFWHTNHFIWTWMLMPVLAVGMLVRRDAATTGSPALPRPIFYGAWLLGCCLIWTLSARFWPELIHALMGYAASAEAAALAQQQIGFYLAFALSHILVQHFLGQGKTGLLLINSAIVNVLYYGCAYLTWQVGLWEPTLLNIIRMFGWGMVTGLVTLALQYYWTLRRQMRQPLSP